MDESGPLWSGRGEEGTEGELNRLSNGWVELFLKWSYDVVTHTFTRDALIDFRDAINNALNERCGECNSKLYVYIEGECRQAYFSPGRICNECGAAYKERR